MSPELPQSRIKHFVVLMLENRSLDHVFGFFQQSPGQTTENLQAANASLLNLLDPSQPESATNPKFTVSQPAPFAARGARSSTHATVKQLRERISSEFTRRWDRSATCVTRSAPNAAYSCTLDSWRTRY